MGTSSSYGGPKGGKPLLPPWADDGDWDPSLPVAQPGSPIVPVDGDAEPEPGEGAEEGAGEGRTDTLLPLIDTEALRLARFHGTRYAGGGGRPSLGRALSSHVKSRGGARNAVRSARSGRASTARLGGFLSTVARSGVEVALEGVGLSHIIGEPADFVLSQIANALSPDGAILEDNLARWALTETLMELYEVYSLEDEGLLALDALDEEGVKGAILASLGNYIYQRFLLEIGDRIERNEIGEQQAGVLERQIKPYIRETVRLDLSNINVLDVDWEGWQGRRIVDKIFIQAYAILEAME